MPVITSYEPFSQQPEYIEANREFLRSLPLKSISRILDLACGTGTLSELLLEIKPELGIVGIDISPESLEIARELFSEKKILVEQDAALNTAIKSGQAAVLLKVGSADELNFLEPESIDLVLMGNAIHLLPDKEKLIQNICRVLRPNGIFAFNSCFFVGTYPEGTESIYTEWMKEALAIASEKLLQLQQSGQQHIHRQRGKRSRAFGNEWLSPSQWQELLAHNNLEVIQDYQRTVMLTQRSLETIGAYAGFAKVALSGYPVELASEALQEAAGVAFKNLDIQEVPRLWLEVAAIKK
jgi:ubiquinone/menaquinone biosynthesis C-methylase UbiE